MKSVLGYNEKPNCLVIDEIDGAPAVSNIMFQVQYLARSHKIDNVLNQAFYRVFVAIGGTV